MSARLRRGSAALLLFGIGFVLIAALGLARPASAAEPPCHAAAPAPARAPAPAPAPCAAVIPLLCCGERTLPGTVAAPPAGGAAELAFLPATPPSPQPIAADAIECRAGGATRCGPPLSAHHVLRL